MVARLPSISSIERGVPLGPAEKSSIRSVARVNRRLEMGGRSAIVHSYQDFPKGQNKFGGRVAERNIHPKGSASIGRVQSSCKSFSQILPLCSTAFTVRRSAFGTFIRWGQIHRLYDGVNFSQQTTPRPSKTISARRSPAPTVTSDMLRDVVDEQVKSGQSPDDRPVTVQTPPAKRPDAAASFRSVPRVNQAARVFSANLAPDIMHRRMAINILDRPAHLDPDKDRKR